MIKESDIPWGPTGKAVYDRTYSRVKPNGERETWPETVARVARGNLALVHGDDMESWPHGARQEYNDLTRAIERFEIVPAGRHLWASGVKGRQYLFNCHVAGWNSLTEHLEFVLMRLAEGGGVGANYSRKHTGHIPTPATEVHAHIVCDPSHPDYQSMRDAGLLSEDYDSNWPGSHEVEDTREGWAAAIVALVDAAMSQDTRHSSRVFDVSRVRWAGARLKTMGGTASGPQPLAVALLKIGNVLNDALPDWTRPPGLRPLHLMALDHAIAEAIVAGGNRRSARMSIVHWRDPDVFDFIECKADSAWHWSTNISVEIDDDFTDALADSDRIDPDATRARKVHQAVISGMLTNGEPGYWNSSVSNWGEPNEVVATNPCGEIALEPWENCNLGHVNLAAFTDHTGLDTGPAIKAHRLITRFLIRATYGDVVDSKQADVLARNRRIGVGHFGVQGYIVKQGLKWSGVANHWPAKKVVIDDLGDMAQAVTTAARDYSHELRIPMPVKTRTVAPTGTIAKLSGDTEGLHPIYARYFLLRVRYSNVDPSQVAQVEEFRRQGYPVEPCQYAPNTDVVTFVAKHPLIEYLREHDLPEDLLEDAADLSVSDMLAMQRLYQLSWADNAVSFTVNVEAEAHQAEALAAGELTPPPPSPERVAEVAETVAEFLPTLKGTTIMVDGTRPQAPQQRITREEYDAAAAHYAAVTDDGIDEECANGACPIK